jgi:hypothetical protein
MSETTYNNLQPSTYTYIYLKVSFSIDTVLSISLLKIEIHLVREWRDGKRALILENMHHREEEDSELNFVEKTEFLKGYGESMLCRM